MTRRRVVGIGLAATMIGAFAGGQAAANTLRMAANTTGKCATCRFWGGARSLTADRRTVVAEGTGVCNNPQSPAYRRQTRGDQGASVWVKWEALG